MITDPLSFGDASRRIQAGNRLNFWTLLASSHAPKTREIRDRKIRRKSELLVSSHAPKMKKFLAISVFISASKYQLFADCLNARLRHLVTRSPQKEHFESARLKHSQTHCKGHTRDQISHNFRLPAVHKQRHHCLQEKVLLVYCVCRKFQCILIT